MIIPLPDLRLPIHVPTAARHREQPRSVFPVAIYTLADVPQRDVDELYQTCKSQAGLGAMLDDVVVAVGYNFAGRALHDIVKHHVAIGPHRLYDPVLFVVIVDDDWRGGGVLLVTLDNSEPEGKTDAFWVRADKTGLACRSLHATDMDWFHAKGLHAIRTGHSRYYWQTF